MTVSKEIVLGKSGIKYEWPFDTEQLTRRLWKAKTCTVPSIRAEVAMYGDTELNAIEKLKFFLNT